MLPASHVASRTAGGASSPSQSSRRRRFAIKPVSVRVEASSSPSSCVNSEITRSETPGFKHARQRPHVLAISSADEALPEVLGRSEAPSAAPRPPRHHGWARYRFRCLNRPFGGSSAADSDASAADMQGHASRSPRASLPRAATTRIGTMNTACIWLFLLQHASAQRALG